MDRINPKGTRADHWNDGPTTVFRIRAEFADDTVAWTTVDHAADILDFIDRDRGISDLIAGVTFRSAFGTMFQIDHNRTDIPCFCVGPWLDDEPGETPDLLEREHPIGSTGCLYPKSVR